MGLIKKAAFFLLLALLFACANPNVSAPVFDINTKPVGNIWYYTLQKGDTLYSAAWRNNLDFQELARLNGIPEPYIVHTGQRLRLNGTAVPLSKAPPQKESSRELFAKISRWEMPVRGKIAHSFSLDTKGIDIATRYDSPVRASAEGKVVYAGFGIPGYRGLIIIKHNGTYLTIYGYNHALLVKNNQWVKSGQIIARAGTNLAGKPMTHFELRKNGKAVNPMRYLS